MKAIFHDYETGKDEIAEFQTGIFCPTKNRRKISPCALKEILENANKVLGRGSTENRLYMNLNLGIVDYLYPCSQTLMDIINSIKSDIASPYHHSVISKVSAYLGYKAYFRTEYTIRNRTMLHHSANSGQLVIAPYSRYESVNWLPVRGNLQLSQ